MIKDILYLIIGGIIAVGIYAYVLPILKTKKTCSECGYKTNDKNIIKCPKCGNPLK